MRLAKLLLLSLPVLAAFVVGCAPKFNLIGDGNEPLREVKLEGEGTDKVLVLSIHGTITLDPRSGLLTERPSVVQEVSKRLKKASKDKSVKALVLAIDSPGGTVTASDILYEEIKRYKKESGAKVVAALLGVAASGGYYAAAAADRIVAHPTTLTGSIGTLFIRPDVAGLMDKIGVRAEVTKSGKYKDMGSFFRESQGKEREMLQEMISSLNRRFLDVVAASRKLTPEELANVADARVMSAEEAKRVKLVDSIGYLHDALAEAKRLAGLDADCRVVVYRSEEDKDDNPYSVLAQAQSSSLLQPELAKALAVPEAGFYYLWMPASVGKD
jgi:protease-4